MVGETPATAQSTVEFNFNSVKLNLYFKQCAKLINPNSVTLYVRKSVITFNALVTKITTALIKQHLILMKKSPPFTEGS